MEIDKLYSLIKSKKIVTDTRKIIGNAVFFALKGDNFNGNKFAEDALKKGASLAIVDEKKYEISDKTIFVNDVLTCLQKLSSYHRKKLNVPIIAITGSNGKTTTKELISAVLSKKYKVTNTIGNLNNHIGVPLTLLSMTKKTEIGVVEMGANHPHEIEFLCDIIKPNYGYVTNFGKAHLEGFGSLEGVIKAKSELYDYLKKNNEKVFVNSQDKIQIKQTKDLNKIVFNKGEIKLLDSNLFVEVAFAGVIIKSRLTGIYNFNNMAAAIAIGQYFEVTPQQIKEAIENYEPKNNRSEILKKGNLQIILDAYNANPTSMTLALDNLNQLNKNPKFAVLGDMFELGDSSKKEHQTIVDKLQKLDFKTVYLIGKDFYRSEIKKANILQFKTFDDFKSDFKNPKKGILLIKASRGMALERVLNLIN